MPRLLDVADAAGRLEADRGSSLAKNKVLTEFQPHVTLENPDVHAYEEVT